MNVPKSNAWETATVYSVERLAPDICRLTVSWDWQDIQPKPGQFYMLRAWDNAAGPILNRPISLHNANDQNDTRTFLFQIKGAGTQKLAALDPYTNPTLTLTGPLGNGFALPARPGARIAVVGGGIGTAPLLYLCHKLAETGSKPDFYAGFRDEPYGLDAFQPFVNRIALATDSGAAGHHGLVTDLLDPAQYDAVMACGPMPMLKAVAAKCRQAGTPCQVSLEKKMACGLGACLGCSIHTTVGARTVCKDGPVFNAEEVF